MAPLPTTAAEKAARQATTLTGKAPQCLHARSRPWHGRDGEAIRNSIPVRPETCTRSRPTAQSSSDEARPIAATPPPTLRELVGPAAPALIEFPRSLRQSRAVDRTRRTVY